MHASSSASHVVHDVLAAWEYVPAAHVRHSDEPVTGTCSPGAHASHEVADALGAR